MFTPGLSETPPPKRALPLGLVRAQKYACVRSPGSEVFCACLGVPDLRKYIHCSPADGGQSVELLAAPGLCCGPAWAEIHFLSSVLLSFCILFLQ